MRAGPSVLIAALAFPLVGRAIRGVQHCPQGVRVDFGALVAGCRRPSRGRASAITSASPSTRLHLRFGPGAPARARHGGGLGARAARCRLIQPAGLPVGAYSLFARFSIVELGPRIFKLGAQGRIVPDSRRVGIGCRFRPVAALFVDDRPVSTVKCGSGSAEHGRPALRRPPSRRGSRWIFRCISAHDGARAGRIP